MAFTSDVAEVSGSAVTPKAPAPSQGDEIIGNAIASGVSAFAAGQPARKKAAIETATNTALGSFNKELSTLADAVATNQMKASDAKMRSRALLAKAINTNPSLTKEFQKFHKGFMSTPGQGEVISKGSEKEQLRNAQKEGANKAGFILPSMDEDQVEEATDMHLRFERIKAQQIHDNAVLAHEKTTGQIIGQNIKNQASQLALNQAIRKEQGTRAVAEIADVYTFKINNDFKELESRFDRGELSLEEYSREVNNAFAPVSHAVSSAGRFADNTFVGSVVKPMEDLKQVYLDRAKGTVTKEAAQNQVETLIAKQKLNILTTSPDVLRMTAFTQLLRDSGASFFGDIQIQALESMAKNSPTATLGKDGHVKTPAIPSEVPKAHFDIIKANADAQSKGNSFGGEEAGKELDVQLNSLLKGVDVHSQLDNEAKDYVALVDLMARPSVGQRMVSSGGIDKALLPQAKRVFEEQYETVTRNAIVKAFNQSEVALHDFAPKGANVGTKDKTFSEVIVPVFTGTGVVFQAAKGQTDRRVTSEVRKLNKEAGPALNRLIRLSAHLSGTLDYKKVYEENFSDMFAKPQEGEPAPQDDQAAVSRQVPEQVKAAAQAAIDKGADPAVVNKMLKDRFGANAQIA